MDQNIAALISAISEANMQARRDHELAMAQLVQTQNEAQQQARREHEQALTQLMQGQNAFMERFGAAMSQPGSAAREANNSLVDQRGVGKPPTLTGRIASDPLSFRAWRIKFRNWVVAAIPEASEVMERLETQNQDEITDEIFAGWVQQNPIATRLSAQVGASLIALTEDEPFQILTRGPPGPRAGLENLRRIYQRFDPTGPRSAKYVLRRIMAMKPVPVSKLRNGIEEMEKLFEEYRARSGNPIQDDLRTLFLEQILEGAVATHVDRNASRLGTYAALRSEIWTYAERIGEHQRDGVVPMDIGAVQRDPSRRPSTVTCWSCGKTGHRASECKAPPPGGHGTGNPNAGPKGPG